MKPRVLFASAEALPFSKTGGLADVAQALPKALAALGADLRLLTPAYAGALEQLREARCMARFEVRGMAMSVWEGCLESSNHPVWLLDCPPLYVRPGGPYGDEHGRDHADNAWRFGCFSEAIAILALGAAQTAWTPDLVHLNDWHTGLAAMWLSRSSSRPRLLFTIHNLAYQGQFGRSDFDALGLPAELWRPDALEFHGGFSFMKAALRYSDALTTVSPGYAREIQTSAAGEQLDGLLCERADALQGILNGIDTDIWNPATDTHLMTTYDARTVVEGKRANKRALQQELGLAEAGDRPLFGVIARLVHQKGADLLFSADSQLEAAGAQLVVLGAGDPQLEAAFTRWHEQAPGRVEIRIGYDERLAHRIEAGADFFLMPSRFEPCGLNQMYSQRYGTVPIVHRTGGLADSVEDLGSSVNDASTGTGILFDHADAGGLRYGIEQALALYRDAPRLRRIQHSGMHRDFSWMGAARAYLHEYQRLLA